jgi:hypothetical protein
VLDALFIQLTGNGIDPCWDLCTGTDFIKTYKNICIFTSFSIFLYHFNPTILTFETNSFETRTVTNRIISFTENHLLKEEFEDFKGIIRIPILKMNKATQWPK